MKLIAKGGYASAAAGPYRAGDEIHVSDALGEFLLRDSPGTFERADVPAQPALPPQEPSTEGMNRQMRGGRSR